MDLQKYRKLYLKENWGSNEFKMIEYYVDVKGRLENLKMSNDFQINHSKVLSGEGYWITHEKLCIGYVYSKNYKIFRPIFSYKRQRLLDKVNKDIYNPINFWNKVKSKYFLTLSENKKIPLDCVKIIINFIY